MDAALVKYTALLALFTALLFVSAAIQAGLFVWQLILIRQGTRDAKDVALAAQASAQAAKESTDLARAEFAATHRPRLRVRHVWQIGDFGQDEDISSGIEIVNVGGTPAVVIDYSRRLLVRNKGERLPMPPHYASHAALGITLASGEDAQLSPLDQISLNPLVYSAVKQGSDSTWPRSLTPCSANTFLARSIPTFKMAMTSPSE